MRRVGFIRARGGGVSVLTAVSSVALIGFTGFAVDLGGVYLESRRLQGSADLAALAAMQNPAQAEALAAATVAANRWPHDTRVRVVRGTYAPDRSVRPAERFRPNAAGSNAVRVEVTTSARLFFARVVFPRARMTIRRSATAAETRMASFQIGTRLLSLQGGVANQVLSGLTGSSVNLSVMDYNALLRADVDVLDYAEALRTRLDLQAASYNETLDASAEAPAAIAALADVVAQTDERAERALRAMARASERSGPLRGLSNVIDLGPYGSQDHATRSADTSIRVSAMDLATAILQVANGDRQVQLDLGAGVPGLASTNVWLAIGERPNNSPWLTVTNDSDVIIRTAQTRLYVEANAGAGALANVRIPILLELASGQARLEEVACGWGGSRSVTLDVSPGVGSLMLGEVDRARLNNFRSELNLSPAQLTRAGPARVEGEARIDVGGHQWSQVRFSGADIESGVVKSVATRDAARATVSSLLGRTRLTVRAGGLASATGALTAAVQGVLASAAAPFGQSAERLVGPAGRAPGRSRRQGERRALRRRCIGGVMSGAKTNHRNGRRSHRAAAAVVAAGMAHAGAALAANDTDTFEVTATVLASCEVSANDLVFGDYDPVVASPLDAETQLSVTCTNGTPYHVGLSLGDGAGAALAARRMTKAGDTETLNYVLYQDSQRSVLWGNAGGDRLAGTGDGAANVLDVYGRIPMQQAAPAGSYADTIVVTVTW